MKLKMKKLSLIAGMLIFVLCMNLGFVGCGKEETNDKNKKYDVSIKVVNNFGGEWIFTPDIDELTYEFDYTGEEMSFWVKSYNLPKHPRWSNEWFDPDSSGANVFIVHKLYCAPGGKNKSFSGPVKEKGQYCITIDADSTSNIWNFREVYLNIIV